ncbi:MAG: hypothetical protein WBK55_02310 [Alphaproteobacteria bacterium]
MADNDDVCWNCGGEGETSQGDCEICDGNGYLRKTVNGKRFGKK